MNFKPLVSIITPCYNSASTIRETIDSVINQSYQNWELIIVDDCSTDDSRKIIEEYRKKDKRIRYFKTDNPSGSPALPRNIGIEESQGKYIAFLDSDDMWFPFKLDHEIVFMERNNYSLVYSYYEKMDSEGNRNKRIIQTRKVTTYDNLLKSNSIPCLTSLISREAIGNIRFKQIPQEDFCFWLDILKKGYRAYNLCEVTALYREANDSRSSNKLDMFRGYWNVIRNQQKISLFPALFYMTTYTILGVAKYIK
ncbi:MAG: glycosyltransferase [Muribaculaceae bacterium]|nr:glycosyltransferase [Muribaculaceae bacterium]MDE6753214.1 glycosyltransferase [Muribaculaceae bacterium]